MASPIQIKASSINRPGVFVTQTSTGGLPQPLATHAVGYIFGTTPTEDYYGADAVDAHSEFEPYKPTQVGSVDDYVRRVGGIIPESNRGALTSYDSVRAFFDNVGVNGILYFTRVAPTPETVISLGGSGAGFGYNAFALKINGRYFGIPIGIPDPDGIEIRVIVTTAIDEVDNSIDIYNYLANNGDGFTDLYAIEQNAEDALLGRFRIFSRDSRNLPRVDRFFAYKFTTSGYTEILDLNISSVVRSFTSIKEINFRCSSRDVATGGAYENISGAALSAFNAAKSTSVYGIAVGGIGTVTDSITLPTIDAAITVGSRVMIERVVPGDTSTLPTPLTVGTPYFVKAKTGSDITLSNTLGGTVIAITGTNTVQLSLRKIAYDPATEQSKIITEFYTDQAIPLPTNAFATVSVDKTSGLSAAYKWPDASAGYYSKVGIADWILLVTGPDRVTPSGSVTGSARSGYLPNSVQVFYVNVAGEDRAIIVNGATPDALTKALSVQINKILAEKNLDGYYTAEAVPYPLFTDGLYYPNNGRAYGKLLSVTGTPYVRPEPDDITLTGTAKVVAGAVTGVATLFQSQLAVGDLIAIGGTRFTVATVTSDTAMTVLPNNVNIAAGASIAFDKSVPNGFASSEYILKVKVTSNNGVSSPINPGKNRAGVTDDNVVKLVSISQDTAYDSYKTTALAKAQDFCHAIEVGMGSAQPVPGFLIAPEAYSVLAYEAGTGDFTSEAEAREARLKVTQMLLKAAEGGLGSTEGISGTQHIALIDCGGDDNSMAKVQDDLAAVRAKVGVPFGHASYYAPYIKNLDDRFVPPSGFVAGIACSRYINEGFQQPPAGARYPMRGAVGLKFDISAQQQEVTYALGLNPIRSLPTRGIVAWGARTLSPNPLFKFVNTRAILNVLIDVLSRSFDDILFEQIDSAGTVYARVKSIASQVLGQFYRQGALFGSRPEQAYLVVCSSANNNTVDLEAGTVRLDVYVATSPTLERMLVTIVRTPAGQVAQLSDSFSRNEERFSTLLSTSSVF